VPSRPIGSNFFVPAPATPVPVWDLVAEYERHEPEKALLHQVLREQLASFLASATLRDQPTPRFIEQELRAFLRCGVLAHGFLRLHCDACGHDRLVAFSCKRRGFCPSCGGRRMADTAAHLVDRVLPDVPIRQWVVCSQNSSATSDERIAAQLRLRCKQFTPTEGIRPHPCGEFSVQLTVIAGDSRCVPP
jgi:hypothetical protein